MLNPELYARLRRQFGKVKILHDNETATRVPVRKGTKVYYRAEGGEEYNCCCPFCNDKGFHLYINYTYGKENYKGFREFATAHCFHGCLDNPENRKELYRMLFAFPIGHAVSTVVTKSEEPERAILPPGKMVLVSRLDADHPAVKYLCEGRNFSLSLLDYYGVSYCYDSITNPLAVGRIIIPIWFKGKYAGWQSRRIGDGLKGAKYITAPGMKKSRVIYNYDNAVLQDHVVICEGVTDVWRVGSAGVCLFGKTISEEQLRLIKEGWSDKDICLLLDPDAAKETAKLFDKLKRECKNVFIVELPEGVKDAALMNETELSLLIKECRYVGHTTGSTG